MKVGDRRLDPCKYFEFLSIGGEPSEADQDIVNFDLLCKRTHASKSQMELESSVLMIDNLSRKATGQS